MEDQDKIESGCTSYFMDFMNDFLIFKDSIQKRERYMLNHGSFIYERDYIWYPISRREISIIWHGYLFFDVLRRRSYDLLHGGSVCGRRFGVQEKIYLNSICMKIDLVEISVSFRVNVQKVKRIFPGN